VSAAQQNGGPMVRRLQLGARLRNLRMAAGVARDQAGYAIRGSESKISRMELGRVSFKERDVADLLSLYGVGDEDPERERLIALAREANNPGWWHRYGDVLPNWFQSYLGLEAAAALIRNYEVQFIPGLLQTPEYARAVVLLGHEHASEHELERRVGVRIARQRLLHRTNPPQVWAVVDEAALRRPIGGPAVMRAQIKALIATTELPNVRLQVVPFDVGGHAAAGGAFSILRFPDADLPDVVYVEQLNSALYLDKREDVEQYTAALEALCITALPPARTIAFLRDLVRDLGRK
jgi:Domain of unknown function (DUF5753)/Helix-turn-helix domain